MECIGNRCLHAAVVMHETRTPRFGILVSLCMLQGLRIDLTASDSYVGT